MPRKANNETKEWRYRPSEKARSIINKEHAKALEVRENQSRNTTIDEIIIRSK